MSSPINSLKWAAGKSIYPAAVFVLVFWAPEIFKALGEIGFWVASWVVWVAVMARVHWGTQRHSEASHSRKAA